MNGFKEALIKHFHFTEQDWQYTRDFFIDESVKARDYFHKAGYVANKLGFVTSGILRSYFHDDQGKEITTGFFQKGTVVILPESFNSHSPAKENIVAYEDSGLVTITSDNLKQLYKKVPKWQQICKDVSNIKNSKLQNRAIQFQTLSTRERYQRFCQEYPGIILKAPLIHIASYLGMDIATLSRLRGKH